MGYWDNRGKSKSRSSEEVKTKKMKSGGSCRRLDNGPRLPFIHFPFATSCPDGLLPGVLRHRANHVLIITQAHMELKLDVTMRIRIVAGRVVGVKRGKIKERGQLRRRNRQSAGNKNWPITSRTEIECGQKPVVPASDPAPPVFNGHRGPSVGAI